MKSKKNDVAWACETCETGDDYYMLQHKLWDEISGGLNFLCLKCVEQRLGRPLKLKDFLKCPVNSGCFGFSAEEYVKEGRGHEKR